MTTKLNHVVKDSVFRALFSEPQNLLQLYQSLHPEDTQTTEQDLHIVTMGQMFFNGIYNDLGFLVGNRLLILAEAQSTWSKNIVLRELMYLVGTYQEYLTGIGANLYGSRPVEIPKPELYVIYTKERGNLPEWLSFKDVFFPDDDDCAIDARARVIYADESDSLVNQYIRFCMVLDRERQLHGDTAQAITETIRICCDENLIREFLNKRRLEVERMLGTLFTQEYVDSIRDKEITNKALFKVVLNMLRSNKSISDIVDATELSADEIRSYAKLNGLSVV